ncbi:hypothetical protein RYX36_015015, partial [Vicia faba]
YISRLWAAITIQEDTRNRKDKQTHSVDSRVTSPTTQERNSLKSQGRGYISRLWAAITIQEDTRNRKDKQTHSVDCPSYKSHDTGAEFSKNPRSRVHAEAKEPEGMLQKALRKEKRSIEYNKNELYG